MLKSDIVKLPDEVTHIIAVLNDNGYEAYAVGGCVRDSILGRIPKDWDITTNASPEKVKGLFDKTLDSGIQHGTVTVVLNGSNFEITTYRIEGEYIDNRRPVNVEFTTSLEADLSRRDFSVNAIAYHPFEGFRDPFDGFRDIMDKIIRAVGNADERFNEDALRMMRAVRFSAKLDFSLCDEVLASIRKNCHLIKKISAERVREEITGILMSNNPMKFILLRDTGLLQYIMPEFEVCFHTNQNNPYHIYNVGIHSLKAAACIENSIDLRWAMLLHDIGKPSAKITDTNEIDHFYGHSEKSVQLAEIVMNRMRFDKKTINKVARLIRHHDRIIAPACKSIRKAMSAVGNDLFDELLKVRAADIKAQNPSYVASRLEELEAISKLYYNILKNQQCTDLKSLKVNGNDLIAEGFEQGMEIRIVLNKLLDLVLEKPELNEKCKLLEFARTLKMPL